MRHRSVFRAMRLTSLAILAVVTAVGISVAAAAEPAYFPPTEGAWERISPARAGWNPDKLQQALDCAGKSKSSGVVILLGGKILAEQYWEFPGERRSLRYRSMIHGNVPQEGPIEDVASAQKSVVSYLAGVAQAKGLLDFAAPVSKYLGPGWSKASARQEAEITVRHLLSMSGGLNDKLEFQAPAGRRWLYNTTAYSRLHAILEKAAGADINTLTRKWLTTPTGMRNSRWVKRPSASDREAVNAFGFATTARDLARFGLLVLRRGHWNERDLLKNPQYLKSAFAPSQEMNNAYGLLWWLNGQPVQRGARKLDSLIPSAPKDLFAAQGALGRKLYIVPSLDLVVTRLGDQAPGNFPNEFWTALMQAVPARPARSASVDAK